MRLRRPLILIFAATLLSLSVTVLTAPSASAHGAMMKPGSRTFLCWQDGLRQTGQIIPINPACGAAVGQSGENSLYNWFGVLRSDGRGRTRGFIPDGELCSGGNPGYVGFNQPRDDWALTHLTSGANFDWWHSNWAEHPGTFRMYVTRDGWSPTQPLRWDDLMDQPFLSVTDPPKVGNPGTNDGHYYWPGAMPSGKSGRHIIYTIWQRSDSQETFYGCSDVVFDGGNGEVTGVGEAGPGPEPGTTPCTHTVTINNVWTGGFQGSITVRNSGNVTISPWNAGWHLEAGAIVSGWNATVSQSAHMVTAAAPSWNPSLPPGASVTIGFVANGSPTPAPTAVTLNGTLCTV